MGELCNAVAGDLGPDPAGQDARPHGVNCVLGVDTGGTFTDFVLISDGTLRVHKVLSTPIAPEQAILQGIAEMGLNRAVSRGELVVVHGSTVATNAALEGKGVRTLYVCNRGFADLLTIGRQNRRSLYRLAPEPNPQPVARELCVEVGGRVGARGEILSELSADDLSAVTGAIRDHGTAAVAINLLFSFLEDRFERAIEAAIGDAAFVARSSWILPEYREYERGMATWLSAWLGPVVARYLERLRRELQPAPLTVMQSSGGTIDATGAARRAVNLLLSGPAGGLAGALFVGREIGRERLLSFDMGGTSTDVSLIDGDIARSSESWVGPYPVAVPMVDIRTIGAGGGSIAFLDDAGVLHVGPESAGAVPGPACYGQGGSRATVTDANLVLGRLRADAFLGGKMALSLEAAREAVGALALKLDLSIEDTARGILSIANEHMAQALRVISVQRGYDLSDFSLCSFGGAGGLHVCALAEALQMRRAMVPVYGGVLSALGLAVAPRARYLSRSVLMALDRAIAERVVDVTLRELEGEGLAEMQAEGVDPGVIKRTPSLDLRYAGQSYCLNVPWQENESPAEAFHRQHLRRYGHRMDLPVELVNVRLTLGAQLNRWRLAELPSEPGRADEPECIAETTGGLMARSRDELPVHAVIPGPLLICEQTATTFVAPGWQVQRDEFGNLLLSR